MQYFFSRSFEKQFSKLPKRIKDKAISQLQVFVKNPMDPSLSNHSLMGQWGGHRSINITGDIRAVYLIKDPGVAHLVAIGSHSQLYK